jgi:hypothetical protein
MEIMHEAVTKIAQDEDFLNKSEILSDYYQIEVTNCNTKNDIVLMVHVTHIKTKSFLKIYS